MPIEFKPATAFVPEGDEAVGWVWWDEITQADIDAFTKVLDTARSEPELQSYLRDHPLLLIQHLTGGHGRWVRPMERLGAEHVTDFVIGTRDSLGTRWTAVELESPRARVFTQAGNPSATLTHAIRQVQDWRNWLTSNIDYARRPTTAHGRALTDIDPDAEGLIIIGRDSSVPETTRELRRRMGRENNMQIRTFDWLLRQGQGRVVSLEGSAAQAHRDRQRHR